MISCEHIREHNFEFPFLENARLVWVEVEEEEHEGCHIWHFFHNLCFNNLYCIRFIQLKRYLTVIKLIC